jgi:uncharacterized Zn-binding protein involved in type VI secretion
MKRALLWSATVALATVGALGAVEYVHFRAYCEQHLAWKRVRTNPSAVVRDDGFAVARAGDAIYLCATVHCFGPLGCHDDLSCDCAPATLGSAAVGRIVGGTCAVEKAEPLRTDAFGACRHAQCDQHIGP